MNETILIVEDDPKLRSGLRDNLEFEGYRVLDAWNAEQGAGYWRGGSPKLVLLDLMLPGRSGFQLLRQMRAGGFETPVIILSARGEEWDKVMGFRLGCDDYVVKPFSLMELLERIKLLLRRSAPPAAPVDRVQAGGLILDLANQSLIKDGEALPLTGMEFNLAVYLFRNQGRVIPRAELLEKVWGASPELQTRTVDVHIAGLRRALEGSDCVIETVYKAGYRLRVDG